MKENTEKLFQIEGERGQNALYNPGLGRWSRETLLGQSVNLSVVCELMSYVSVNLLTLIVILWLHRSVFVLGKYHSNIYG